MAAITIAANANWSASGITAADDVTVNVAVVLTLDAVGVCNTLTVNGTLFIQRTGTTSITCAGLVKFNSGGILDAGTVVSPIVGNTTIATTNANIDILFNDGSEVRVYNATPRTRIAALTADTTLGSNIISVDSASNWAVGDVLVFEDAYTVGFTTPFSTTVAAVAGLQITLTANAPALLDGTANPLVVHNLTDRITISFNGGHFLVKRTNASSNNKFLMRGCVVVGGGRNGFSAYTAFRFEGGWGQGHKGAQPYGILLEDCGVLDGFGGFEAFKCEVHLVRCCAASRVLLNKVSRGMMITENTHVTGTDVSLLNFGRVIELANGGIHQGSFTRLDGLNCGDSSRGLMLSTASFDIAGGRFRNLTNGAVTFGCSTVTFRSIAFSNVNNLIYLGGFGRVNIVGCTVPVPNTTYVGAASSDLSGELFILNRNNDPTAQEYHNKDGAIIRDTVTAISPTSKPASLRMVPINASVAVSYKTSVSLLSGQVLTASVQARANVAYNGSTRPLIRISGTEFDTAQTMSAANDVFELVALTSPPAINTHTVTVSVEAIGTAGSAWFDDLTIGGSVHDIGQNLFAGGTEISNVIDITDTGVNLALTGLQVGTDVVILAAGTNTVLASVDQTVGTSYTYSNASNITIDIGIIKPGFVTKYIYGFVLNSKSASIPINQSPDRSYV